MKIVLASVLSGVIGAFLTANLLTGAHAQNDVETLAQAIKTGQCEVNVGAPSLQGGYRCFGNKVMSGLWNGSLYCSELQVTCQ